MKRYTKQYKRKSTVQFAPRLVILLSVLGAFVTAGVVLATTSHDASLSVSAQESSSSMASLIEDYKEFERPEGPVTVGLQVGHLENELLPDELEALRGVSTGTSGGGTTEVDVVATIAALAAEQLESEGIQVDILSSTVPQDYYADAFISLHADGNTYSYVNGYKVAASQLSLTSESDELAAVIDASYAASTQLSYDDNVTMNMLYYYTFNWLRYEHSVHPFTPAVLLEVGFLTSTHDQQVIVHQPELAAEGVSDGIIEFLQQNSLIE